MWRSSINYVKTRKQIYAIYLIVRVDFIGGSIGATLIHDLAVNGSTFTLLAKLENISESSKEKLSSMHV